MKKGRQWAIAGLFCLMVLILFSVFVYRYAPYRHAQGLAAIDEEIVLYEKLAPEQAKQLILNRLKEKNEACRKNKLW